MQQKRFRQNRRNSAGRVKPATHNRTKSIQYAPVQQRGAVQADAAARAPRASIRPLKGLGAQINERNRDEHNKSQLAYRKHKIKKARAVTLLIVTKRDHKI